MNVFRLGLAVPSLHTWEADFALCITQLCLFMARVKVPGYDNTMLTIMNRRGSLLTKSRRELVVDAQKRKCTHILFVDSDQTFPKDLVHRLAKHGKRVIGCNVATKNQENSLPTARRKPNPGEWWGGHVVYSNGRDDIEQVWRLGFGIMLIKLDVFDEIEKPWFGVRYVPELDEDVGEDWWFCERLEAKGIPIWVDHGLSLEVGHVGKWIYNHDDVVGQPDVKEAA